MMESERKINLSEGIPLNSECSTNIILNTGHQKMSTTGAGSAVIQLKSNEKSSPHDVGVHINTTLSIASSKKMKLLFGLNFLLSFVCILISSCIAFHYFNEMTTVRRQLEAIKDQLITYNLQSHLVKQQANAAETPLTPQGLQWPRQEQTQRRQLGRSLGSSAGKKYYVDDLEEDLHFINSKNKKGDTEMSEAPSFLKQDAVIAHFVGGGVEKFLGEDPYIGPWMPDYNASSKDFSRRLQLTDSKSVNVYDGGIYLIYAQLVYVTNAPNFFSLWAENEREGSLRMLAMCSSGDVVSRRSVRNSQITCAAQTVARLNRDDVITFSQREKNSTVLLRAGYSYFGFVKLSS